MRIIIFGARGDVGSRIVAEALRRSHQVTGVVRQEVQRESMPPGVTAEVADVANTDDVARLMSEYDLAIGAVRPPDGKEHELVALTRSLLDAAALSGLRLLLVGGAASLNDPDGKGAPLIENRDYVPEAYLPIAKASFAQFELCTKQRHTDWTYLCPPAELTPGNRTGYYRVGSDVLLTDPQGVSRISMEDFAVALLDEAEDAIHRKSRFTVAY